MNYDFTAARAYFAQKSAATTGPHELSGMSQPAVVASQSKAA